MSRFLCATILTALMATPALADSVLTITGQGTAVVDTLDARITGNIDNHGATAAEAIAAHRGAAADLAKTLARLGVTDKNFTVTGINLNPQYAIGPITNGQPRAITGYNCSTQISVTVEDPTKLDSVMQALASGGASQSLHISYVGHNMSALQDAARAMAVKDAFAHAQVLAKQTGVTLGPVVSVTDGVTPANIFNYTQQLLIGGLNGQHTVAASVTVSWAIK
jgi:uncharacterized protein YggE